MVSLKPFEVSSDLLFQAAHYHVSAIDNTLLDAASFSQLQLLRFSLSVFRLHLFFSKISKTVTIFKPHIKIKWWLDYLFTNTFSAPEKQMFQIYLLRTHPRFPCATWPSVLPQVPRYPLGRSCSVTPPLSVEKGNSC